MPESAPAVVAVSPKELGENKGIKFLIRTGTNSYQCTLQDRSHYERMKAGRTNSTDSVVSDASSNA